MEPASPQLRGALAYEPDDPRFRRRLLPASPDLGAFYPFFQVPVSRLADAQLALIGEEIGDEVHDTHDQFFRFEEGEGEVVIDGVTSPVSDDVGVVVPAGARHNVRNTGSGPLKLYTIFGPPEHRFDVAHETRPDAEMEEEHFDGRTTELR